MGTGIKSSKSNFQFSDNEYGYIGLSANQTTGLANTNPVKFNTMLAGNITFNPATYQVTLKKNRTYKLYSMLIADFSGNTGVIRYQFYDVTNATSIGKIGIGLAATWTSNVDYKNGAFVIITPTVDTVVELRIGTVTALTGIIADYSYWEIQQINIVSPVIQDPTRVYAYVSPQLILTGAAYVAGGGSLSSTIRSVAQFFKTSDGKWYIQSNCIFTVSSASRTAMQLTIGTGFTFKNIANFYQIASGCNSVGSTIPMACYCVPNTGNVSWAHSTATTTDYGVTLFAELDAKPTIAGIPSDV